MTESLEDRIKRHEGFRSKPYLDTTGNWTIGFGHKLTDDQAQEYANGIDEITAEDILEKDITAAQAELNHALLWVSNLNDTRHGILVEIAFQLGLHGLLLFRRMLAALQDGDYQTAANEMLNSVWHTQTPERCEELSNLMASA